MHRQGQSLLIIIASAVLWTNAARGEVDEMRRALLIGNDAYTGEVKELNNAYSDVELVAKALQRDWFNVKALKDASRDTILAEVRSFAISLKDRGPNVVGFFYYAGHGASDASSGENYLIPVNVQRVNAEIWVKSVKVADIVDILATAENSIQFVIFDACRDELGEARPETVRAGFTPMQQKAAMLVGYSTAPGKEAIDGDGDNGPYASALAEELTRPGLDALLVFAIV